MSPLQIPKSQLRKRASSEAVRENEQGRKNVADSTQLEGSNGIRARQKRW